METEYQSRWIQDNLELRTFRHQIAQELYLDGKQIGYLDVRGKTFSARYPDKDGEAIYSTEDRVALHGGEHLDNAILALLERHQKNTNL